MVYRLLSFCFPFVSFWLPFVVLLCSASVPSAFQRFYLTFTFFFQSVPVACPFVLQWCSSCCLLDLPSWSGGLPIAVQRDPVVSPLSFNSCLWIAPCSSMVLQLVSVWFPFISCWRVMSCLVVFRRCALFVSTGSLVSPLFFNRTLGGGSSNRRCVPELK